MTAMFSGTPTLGEMAYRVARMLGGMVEGTTSADGNGTTKVTMIDTIERLEASDYWNLGTVWILRESTEAGLAPEGEARIVSDFDTGVSPGTGTITVRDAFSAQVKAGAKYALSKKKYPLWLLYQKVNEALVELGPIKTIDITSITLLAGATEYTLPVAATDLREVRYQNITTDADNNEWLPILGWDIIPATTGTGKTLALRRSLPTTHKIMLVFMAVHPELDDSTDQINEFVHPDLVTYEAARRCVQWRASKAGRIDKIQRNLLDELERKAIGARAKHRLPVPQRSTLLVYGGYDDEDLPQTPAPV